jgi:O-antigen/teichoic acid export membrane protein
MKPTSFLSLLNVAIKVATNGFRLIFLLVLPQFISMESFGIYAVVLASVTLGAYLLGFEFHYDSNRQLRIPAAEHRQTNQQHVANRLALFALTYTLFLPVILAFADFGIDSSLSFLILCIAMHLNLENTRLLIFLGHPIRATICNGIGQGLWAVPMLVVLYTRDTPLDLTSILQVQSVFLLIGIAVTAPFETLRRVRLTSLSLAQIRRGVGVGVLMLVSVLCLKGGEFAGRFFLAAEGDNTLVGQLSYMQYIGVGLLEVLTVGLLSFWAPHIIERHRSTQAPPRRETLRELLTLILVSAVLVVLLMVLPVIAFPFTDKFDFIRDNYSVLLIVLVAYASLSFSNYFAIHLQGMGTDRVTMWINVIAALSFSLSLAGLSMFDGITLLNAALALLIWSVVLALPKGYWVLRGYLQGAPT